MWKTRSRPRYQGLPRGRSDRWAWSRSRSDIAVFLRWCGLAPDARTWWAEASKTFQLQRWAAGCPEGRWPQSEKCGGHCLLGGFRLLKWAQIPEDWNSQKPRSWRLRFERPRKIREFVINLSWDHLIFWFGTLLLTFSAVLISAGNFNQKKQGLSYMVQDLENMDIPWHQELGRTDPPLWMQLFMLPKSVSSLQLLLNLEEALFCVWCLTNVSSSSSSFFFLF